jgi:protein SCO1
MLNDIYADHAVDRYADTLPYFGPDSTTARDYVISDFSFYDQDSQLVSLSLLQDKIWICNYFFATCTGICPIMNHNLIALSDSFAYNSNIDIVSHTVDPEVDSISALKAYSKDYAKYPSQWHFVTGSKKELYDRARNVYILAEPSQEDIQEDFVHSQLICLIDQNQHIRGYYDGTKPDEIQKLIQDIKKLK